MEKSFINADLTRVRDVRVTYTDLDDNSQEIFAEVNFISDTLISLYFHSKEDFNINYPQTITIKFITERGLFIAKATLQEVKKQDSFVYFTILAPKKIEHRQNRKYYRINLRRTCVLVATDEEGNSTAFMSRLVNISACGILMYKLETMFDSKYVAINPEDYDFFTVVLFLDIDIVLKLSARYVRQEQQPESPPSYAFEFIEMKNRDINTISKYLTKKQLEQIKKQKKLNL